MKALIKILIINTFLLNCIYSADPKSPGETNDYEQEFGIEHLGRVGDYGYPKNPQYDRAKGYLLKGKVKNAVTNQGNFITWDYHPAGFWGEYGYLPHLSFVAGIPGHAYSSEWSKPGVDAWELDGNGIWSSSIIYKAWMEDITDIENDKNISNLRLTVDRIEDFELIKQILNNISINPIHLEDVLELFSRKPELIEINKHINHNEGFNKSLEEDKEFIKKQKR